jgi:carbonic anhydrase/acetyltransferase-like protein (isoleucine patch superfamily)
MQWMATSENKLLSLQKEIYMALIKPLRGFTPEFGENCYFTETCVIVGDVKMGNDCTIWYNAVVRGDVNSIRIGNSVNIQDGAIIHCNYKDSVSVIGDNVSIGHNAIIHGATIEDGVLIGMGAIIMDHAHVKRNSIIAAGALVSKHSVIDEGTVYAGIPALPVEGYNSDEIAKANLRSAEKYKIYREWYEEDTRRKT